MSSTKNGSQNSVWESVKLGFILAAYAVAACTVLAFVNNATKSVIEQNKLNKAQSGMKIVFAEAESFEEASGFASNVSGITIDKVYMAKKGGAVIGGVAQVTGPTYDKGTLLVGLGTDGIVKGISFLELSDTPGFGQKANDPNFTLPSGKTFCGQFAGLKASQGFTPGVTFDAITGATITSKGTGVLVQTAADVLDSYFKEHNYE